MNLRILATATLGMSISLAALLANAEENLAYSVSEVVYAGNGCPDGTLTTKLENNKVSLSLESMLVVADAESAQLSRKSCALVIPVTSDKLIRVIGLRAIYSGVATVEENASLKITAEHFLPGQRGRILRASFEQTEPTQFNLQTPVLALNSNCALSSNIRVNFSVLGQARKIGDLAVGQIANASFEVLAEVCE